MQRGLMRPWPWVFVLTAYATAQNYRFSKGPFRNRRRFFSGSIQILTFGGNSQSWSSFRGARQLDDRVWTELLEPMLIGEPAQADRLARMWSYLLSEMEDGPDGVFRARQSIENALRVTFPFTKSYSIWRARYERAARLLSEPTLK